MRRLTLLCALIAATVPALAATESFDACIARIGDEARAEGIGDAVIESVLNTLEPVERVIELDRKQPEFTRGFAQYYLARVTPQRVERGRELLQKHRTLLERIKRETGIPPHYLVSFWGLETNFGSYFGKIPTPRALATLACDQRRGRFFTGELIAALRIIDAGDIPADRMVGSWAGAIGHMQFLPSVYTAHAVDADGDGRRDVWGSVPDALTSAGHYLKSIGWETGLRWGRQVQLPDNFDYSLSGRDRKRPLSDWVDAGVKDVYGRPMPRVDIDAALIVPAGHNGPAYLVYDNFDVIMRWNRSEYYALAVGRLADQIAGGGPLLGSLESLNVPVRVDDVRSLQAGLIELGYEAGEVDGVIGPATRRALRNFQKTQAVIADGHVDQDAIDQVRVALSAE